MSAETRQLVLDTAVEMGYAAKACPQAGTAQGVCAGGKYGIRQHPASSGTRSWPGSGWRPGHGDGPWMCCPPRPRRRRAPNTAACCWRGGYGGAFILGLTPQDRIHACAGRHWHAHSAAGQLRSQRQRRICGHRQLGGRGARRAASGRIGTPENRLFERHAGFNGV